MKKLTGYVIIIGIASLIAMPGCASSDGAQKSSKNDYDRLTTAKVDNPTITLADYLQRIPGITISGSGRNISVLVRGINSFKASTQPLFVVDGVRVGNSYQEVSSLVNMHDVDYIKVLKDSDASIYGVEGGSGVILIETKKSGKQ